MIMTCTKAKRPIPLDEAPPVITVGEACSDGFALVPLVSIFVVAAAVEVKVEIGDVKVAVATVLLPTEVRETVKTVPDDAGDAGVVIAELGGVAAAACETDDKNDCASDTA